jgi:phage-related tail protein
VGIWTGDVPASNGDIVASGNLTTAKDLQCVDADVSGDVSCVNIDATGNVVVTGSVTAGSIVAGAGGLTVAGLANFTGTNSVEIDTTVGAVGAASNFTVAAGNGTLFFSSSDAADPAVPPAAGTLGLGTSGQLPGGANASLIVSTNNQNSVGWLPVSLSLNGAGALAKYYIPLFSAI